MAGLRRMWPDETMSEILGLPVTLEMRELT
jgi:hypothetical protein